MKMTSIDSSVLGGQGSIGSAVLSMPNPAPPTGPAAGVDAMFSVAIPSGAAESGATAPADYPMAGGPSTSDSQYSTIGPIQEG